jgi:hypothetical protein
MHTIRLRQWGLGVYSESCTIIAGCGLYFKGLGGSWGLGVVASTVVEAWPKG